MKKVELLPLVIGVLAGGLATEFLAAKTGRFRVVSGTVEYSVVTDNMADREKEPVILKIDTATGETWSYCDSSVFSSNIASVQQGWQVVKDLNYFTNRPSSR